MLLSGCNGISANMAVRAVSLRHGMCGSPLRSCRVSITARPPKLGTDTPVGMRVGDEEAVLKLETLTAGQRSSTKRSFLGRLMRSTERASGNQTEFSQHLVKLETTRAWRYPMERRNLLKGMALTAAAASATTLGGSNEVQAQGDMDNTVEIPSTSPNYFIPDRFKGKTIVVTGCARGMGAGAATRIAREGANVVGVDWIKEQGEKTIADIVAADGNATFVYGDIGDNDTCDRMIKAAIDNFGGIDMALNNAGVMDGVFSGDPIDYEKQKPLIFAPIHDATDEYWERVFHTNSTGLFRCMRAELKQMVAQGRGGSIVNVASIAGMTGLAGNPAYVASKHAVNGLTRNAAIDYAPHGIRVNSVNMSGTDTPMVERAGTLVAAAMKANKNTGVNMGLAKTFSLLAYVDPNHKPATVAEQVSMMLFLLSNEAANFTGGVFPTDGGWTSY